MGPGCSGPLGETGERREIGMRSRQGPAVVIGASGGIGRALADALSEDPQFDVVVGVSRRRPDGWEFGASRVWFEADILDEGSLAHAAAAITQLGHPARVIVATGRLHGPKLAPEKNMQAMNLEGLTELFSVNAAGPALVAKHFLPVMQRANPSVFAAVSARVGSIGDNALGGWYAYRASKAALNMLIRTLAIEHRRSNPLGVCVALHPGTVDTPLSAPFQRNVRPGALRSAETSAISLLSVLDSLGPDDTGGFYAWDGEPIPW